MKSDEKDDDNNQKPNVFDIYARALAHSEPNASNWNDGIMQKQICQIRIIAYWINEN